MLLLLIALLHFLSCSLRSHRSPLASNLVLCLRFIIGKSYRLSFSASNSSLHWFKLPSLGFWLNCSAWKHCLWASWTELHWTQLFCFELSSTAFNWTAPNWTDHNWIALNSLPPPLSHCSLSSLSFLSVIIRVVYSYLWLVLSNLPLIHHFICLSIRCHCLGLEVWTKGMSVFQSGGLKECVMPAF